jgi:hypothetical protein
MATYAWDVPGYVQGHRFSQDAKYWDPVTSRFRDQAGYDHFGNGCEVAVGTPAFSVHGLNNREGLLLNNSCHLRFKPSIPWEGSGLFVFKPTIPAGTVSQYHWLWGDAATEGSNPRIILVRGSGIISITVAAIGTLSQVLQPYTSGVIGIAAFSTSQETRSMYSTKDGVTVTSETAAPASHGNAMVMGGGSTHVRLGDIIGDGTTTPNVTDYMHLFEQHYWKGNVLVGSSLTKLASFITSLKEYYGLV